MMNEQTKKAIQDAIDFLDGSYEAHKVRKALQEALAQPAQEPFGWYDGMGFSTNKNDFGKAISTAIPLYTHPAPSWQGLADNKGVIEFKDMTVTAEFIRGAFWADKVLKDKNT